METKDIAHAEKNQRREKIMALESKILEMPQADIPINHYFAPGLYLREMRMPKGALVTGKIHKTEHLCILSQGEVSVETDEGMKRIKASTVIHSLPGIKRAIYAHEDSIWINVHHNPSNEKNLEKIDEIFVVDTFDQFLSYAETKQIEGGN
jgi:quercetin dioxygenase-like cupin family protein